MLPGRPSFFAVLLTLLSLAGPCVFAQIPDRCGQDLSREALFSFSELIVEAEVVEAPAERPLVFRIPGWTGAARGNVARLSVLRIFKGQSERDLVISYQSAESWSKCKTPEIQEGDVRIFFFRDEAGIPVLDSLTAAPRFTDPIDTCERIGPPGEVLLASVRIYPRLGVPGDQRYVVGAPVSDRLPDGNSSQAKVVGVSGERITLDFGGAWGIKEQEQSGVLSVFPAEKKFEMVRTLSRNFWPARWYRTSRSSGPLILPLPASR